MKSSHPVADYMHPFFFQYLAGAKGVSCNTIISYRDAIKLFLRFGAKRLKKPVDRLNIEDLDQKMVLAFLNHIENGIGNSTNTRNARLAGIRTFFGFVGAEEPPLLELCRRIRYIPVKRFEHKTVEYLDAHEMQAIFDSIDIKTRTGIRDKALLLVLYNTGARVQEIVDLSINDLRLIPLGQVKLLGKGRKQRACPLWPETIDALKDYLQNRYPKNRNIENVFLNANGTPITRFGIAYIITKHVEKATVRCPTLTQKSVGPHTFRHSTAMHLIQAGNDINMVKLWLGHADINTTHIYVEIDMEMKQKILSTTRPPESHKKETKMPKWKNPDILKWLDDLTKRSAD
jgi:site-specific recombinase XerD